MTTTSGEKGEVRLKKIEEERLYVRSVVKIVFRSITEVKVSSPHYENTELQQKVLHSKH